MDECTEAGCQDQSTVMVYIPWESDRPVCAAHARALVQLDGIVAKPLENAGEEW